MSTSCLSNKKTKTKSTKEAAAAVAGATIVLQLQQKNKSLLEAKGSLAKEERKKRAENAYLVATIQKMVAQLRRQSSELEKREREIARFFKGYDRHAQHTSATATKSDTICWEAFDESNETEIAESAQSPTPDSFEFNCNVEQAESWRVAKPRREAKQRRKRKQFEKGKKSEDVEQDTPAAG